MITDLIKSFYWEILSYFVPQKQEYEIKGSCNKCGKCCETLYAAYDYSEKEFKIMQFIFRYTEDFILKVEMSLVTVFWMQIFKRK